MSLQTWKKEFYPTPANEPRTQLQAIRHSLRKWKGLTPKALKKHQVDKVVFSEYSLRVQDFTSRFSFDASNCALCHFNKSNCRLCPLRSCGELNAGWRVALKSGYPDKMIRDLEACERRERLRLKRKRKRALDKKDKAK